ncbi:MAG: VanW family protein [Candidatus Komeilibacteria bacterium]
MAKTTLLSHHRILLRLLIAAAVIFIVGLLIYIVIGLMQLGYRDRLWPHIKIASIPVGGLTYDEALGQVQKQVDQMNNAGLTFVSPEKKVTISPNIVSTGDPDVARQLVIWNPNITVASAFQLGKSSNPLTNIRAFGQMIIGVNKPVAYTWNRDEFAVMLRQNYAGVLGAKKDAQLYFDGSEAKISNEVTGITFNFDKALKQAERTLGQLDDRPITLESRVEQPQLTVALASPLLERVNQALNFDHYVVKYNKTEYVITPDLLQRWLQFKLVNNTAQLGVDPLALESWLKNIRADVEQQPLNAKFRLENNRVVEFQASQDGQVINTAELIKRLDNNLLVKQDIELPVEIDKPEYTVDKVNNMGIKEILGTGTSNFAGSPKNRRHNIAVGAAALNGLIVKPGEDFSLLKALGTVDGSTGYLQELVIKGDKTIPEYGGGLCQIGTTTFRATLASGLPVVFRRNHSYRVVYYEPAGTDATIYDPWPDYKFKNDTANNLLIQTRIDGDNIYFDFWGTKDGRKVEETEPDIYNIVKPEPGKIVETTSLPVGTKKCTESAHNGADAKFDYTITYPDGRVSATTFRSHYIPWQSVCLVGVEQLSTPTSTPDTAGEVILNSFN